jgi:threonine/homoserine/homoserine lactone efflux protein
VLNPKCTLFMLSIFTLVVKPNTPIYVQCIYTAEIFSIGVVWFIFLSFALTHSIVKNKINKVQHIVNKLIGGVLLLLGVSIIHEA